MGSALGRNLTTDSTEVANPSSQHWVEQEGCSSILQSGCAVPPPCQRAGHGVPWPPGRVALGSLPVPRQLTGRRCALTGPLKISLWRDHPDRWSWVTVVSLTVVAVLVPVRNSHRRPGSHDLPNCPRRSVSSPNLTSIDLVSWNGGVRHADSSRGGWTWRGQPPTGCRRVRPARFVPAASGWQCALAVPFPAGRLLLGPS
jgi:hypothetical protein